MFFKIQGMDNIPTRPEENPPAVPSHRTRLIAQATREFGFLLEIPSRTDTFPGKKHQVTLQLLKI